MKESAAEKAVSDRKQTFSLYVEYDVSGKVNWLGWCEDDPYKDPEVF